MKGSTNVVLLIFLKIKAKRTVGSSPTLHTTTNKTIDMVDEKELRIGNWVSDIHASEFGMWQVTSIRDSICHYGGFRARYKDLLPILLTPDILDKAGAKIWKGGLSAAYIFKIGNQGELIIFPGTSLVGQANGVNENDFYYSFNSVLIIIKYLHQLQNLYFSLTAKELTLSTINKEMEL